MFIHVWPTIFSVRQIERHHVRSCINQMAEASSVMGFIGRAISKAKELAKEGKIKECKKVGGSEVCSFNSLAVFYL